MSTPLNTHTFRAEIPITVQSSILLLLISPRFVEQLGLSSLRVKDPIWQPSKNFVGDKDITPRLLILIRLSTASLHNSERTARAITERNVSNRSIMGFVLPGVASC